ncbi:MAG: T9SS type A sorting domain-containing protein [Sphingobacteriaceae bacterium]
MMLTIRTLIINISLFITIYSKAQLSYAWANSAGSTNIELGQAIAVDPSGNVYVAGTFSGTVDFDPSPSSANLTGFSGSADIFLAKYSSTGAFIWVKQIGGTNTEKTYDLVADATGAWLAGNFMGTCDFDPSIATSNTTSLGGGTDGDGFFAKYDFNGNFQWGVRLGSTANDRCIGIAVDASQNAFVTGFVGGNADMDPSASSFSLMVSGTYNTYFAKYTSTGTLTFAKQITGGYSEGDDIAIDASGNIYLTGSYATANDFDPSIATANLSTSSLTQLDIYLAKYDASGNYTFAKQIGGIGVDIGFQVKPDASGNIYLGGVFSNTCDFDPTVTVSNLTSAGQGDLFVAKYTSAGNLIWVNGTGGTTNDYCYGLGLDASNNVYITGKVQGTNIDFDPSISISAVTASSSCVYLAGYNSSGAFQFVHTPGNIASEGRSLFVNSSVYITGFYNNIGDFDFGAPTANLSSVGSSDIFMAKYNLCAGSPPAQPSIISGNTSICPNTSQQYSVTNDPSATGYVWTYPSGWTGTNTTNILSAVSGTSGNITVAASNSCGLGPASSLSVTVNLTPVATASNNGPVCAGSSFTLFGNGASTYTWAGPNSFNVNTQNHAFTNSILSHAGVYTVYVTSIAGCTAVAQTTVVINSLPTVTVNNPIACVGSNLTFSASGANTYTWSGPNSFTSNLQNPTITSVPLAANGQYTLIGKSAAGCSATAISNATVSPAPTASISSNSLVCSGSTLNLFGSGGNTYNWFGPNSYSNTTQNISFASATPSVSGNYTLVAIIGTCTNAATQSVNVNSLPSLTVSASTNSICAGSQSTLYASGASSYTWNTSNVSQSVSVNPTVTTTYSVQGTGTNNCIGTSMITLTIIPLPSINISTSNSLICIGQSAILTGSGAITFTWNTSSNNNTISINPTVTTTYTLTGTGNGGCTNSITFTQNVSSCSGLTELASFKSILVFPNPFTNSLNIQTESEMKLELHNALGEAIMQIDIKQDQTKLDLHYLPNGIYFLKVLNKNESIKLIKAY